jgi:hypothetical protein
VIADSGRTRGDGVDIADISVSDAPEQVLAGGNFGNILARETSLTRLTGIGSVVESPTANLNAAVEVSSGSLLSGLLLNGDGSTTTVIGNNLFATYTGLSGGFDRFTVSGNYADAANTAISFTISIGNTTGVGDSAPRRISLQSLGVVTLPEAEAGTLIGFVGASLGVVAAAARPVPVSGLDPFFPPQARYADVKERPRTGLVCALAPEAAARGYPLGWCACPPPRR